MPLHRAFFLAACALGLSGCFQRKPPETVPDATRPDGTPLVREDSNVPRPKVVEPLEYREEAPAYISATMAAHMTRVQFTGTSFPEADWVGTLVEVEGVLQPLRGRGIGVAGRAVTAGAGSPTYTDIGLLFGARPLALGLGLGSRRGLSLRSGGLLDSTFAFFHTTLRSRVNLPIPGFSTQATATRYFGLPDQGRDPQQWGWNAEAMLSWTAPRIPVTASVGYRRELFRVYGVQQSLRAFTLGGGILFGRTPGPPEPPADPQPTP